MAGATLGTCPNKVLGLLLVFVAVVHGQPRPPKGTTDLATGKTATQSSRKDATKYGPGNAADGWLSQKPADAAERCAHTRTTPTEIMPWW